MGQFKQTVRLAVTAVGVALATSAQAADVVVMDQIGPNNQGVTSQSSVVLSQILDGDTAAFSGAAVDNFSLLTPSRLTSLQAGVVISRVGASPTSYNDITGWDVAIYSSAAAATTSLTGDVANVTLLPAAVTVNRPLIGVSLSALVTMDLSIDLAAGNYWLALMARMPVSSGQFRIYTSSYNGFPNDRNAFLANPGGGGGFPGNRVSVNQDLAYRVLASPVPEPASAVLLLAGTLGLLARVSSARRVG